MKVSETTSDAIAIEEVEDADADVDTGLRSSKDDILQWFAMSVKGSYVADAPVCRPEQEIGTAICADH